MIKTSLQSSNIKPAVIIKPEVIKIDKFFINKTTGQISIVLPKKQMKSFPTKAELKYW